MFVLAGAHCWERHTMTDDGAFGVTIVRWVNGSGSPAPHPPTAAMAAVKASVLIEEGIMSDTSNLCLPVLFSTKYQNFLTKR